MKKIVTALIVVLPLILLVAIFAVTNIVRIAVNVHATGIVIANKGDDGVFTFDIFSNRTPIEEWELGVEVQPLTASDRSYTLSIEDAQTGEPSSAVVLEDGVFTLMDVGVVKLVFKSNDGGYTDSVLFNIVSSGVLDFEPVLKNAAGDDVPLTKLSYGEGADYAVTIESGSYTLGGRYHPEISSVEALFTSSNDKVASINAVSGKLSAVLSGTAVLSMRVESVMPKTIAVTVTQAASVTVNGVPADKNPNLSCGVNAPSFSFFVENSEEISESDVAFEGEDIASVLVKGVDFTSGGRTLFNAFEVTVTLKAPYASPTNKTYSLIVNGRSFEVNVAYANYSFAVTSSKNLENTESLTLFVGDTTTLYIESDPINPKLRYDWTLSDSSCAQIVTKRDNLCELKATERGEATLTIVWNVEGSDEQGEIVRRVKIVDGVSSMLFKENGAEHGLGSLAIASSKFSGKDIVSNRYLLGFAAYGKSGQPAASLEDFDFSLSDPALATVEKDLEGVHIIVKESGTLTVTASWKYGDLFSLKPVSFTFEAVKGVEVTTQSELEAAMAQKLQAVLANDIYLGEQLFDVQSDGARTPKYDDATMRNKLLESTHELKTTWDWTFYKNLGMEQPSMRYCMEFTANVYGNGHFVNAEHITNMLFSESTLYSFAVFRGPLDFVAATNDGSNKLASVKGQDNIVFLIRTDGVTVNNAVLMGCDSESLYDYSDGAASINLSLLNNMGTTLELMANANIVNSRVLNGRTCVRAYGRYGVDETTVNAARERIFVDIENCVIQNAREFLLKVGTNRFKAGSLDDPSPSLYDDSGKEYDKYNSSLADSYINDDYFMRELVLTDVTVKNSTLRTSGLFAIGLESHFAGEMLAGQELLGYKFSGWHDLAATSYPAVLRLKGEVKIEDWKDIANIDSSTLIETNFNSQESNASFLTLNINEMLKHVRATGGEQYAKLLAQKDGKDYAHGGIAFYGGGKNYSVLDLSEYNWKQMTQYNINLSILSSSKNMDLQMQGNLLPLAAGKQDFRFVMLSSDYFEN